MICEISEDRIVELGTRPGLVSGRSSLSILRSPLLVDIVLWREVDVSYGDHKSVKKQGLYRYCIISCIPFSG
jgi:hypothetical protein